MPWRGWSGETSLNPGALGTGFLQRWRRHASNPQDGGVRATQHAAERSGDAHAARSVRRLDVRSQQASHRVQYERPHVAGGRKLGLSNDLTRNRDKRLRFGNSRGVRVDSTLPAYVLNPAQALRRTW